MPFALSVKPGRARIASIPGAGLAKVRATSGGRTLNLRLQQPERSQAVPRRGSRSDRLQGVCMQL